MGGGYFLCICLSAFHIISHHFTVVLHNLSFYIEALIIQRQDFLCCITSLMGGVFTSNISKIISVDLYMYTILNVIESENRVMQLGI